MKNDRLKRILTIVDTVITIRPKERSGYLTKVCGDDESLRKEVLTLLRSIDKSKEFWEEWEHWNNEQIHNFIQESGKRIEKPYQVGEWRLNGLLGSGGMGDVFLAERINEEFEQQAAVKLLRHELHQKDWIKRFGQEIQILAKLDHPNIAGFYDGGITTDGRPWLAMQYVEGITITEWSSHGQRTLEEKLELFQKVCEAVRYAHKNLVVHRDLKPDNILITKQRTVKVLDFGIAKLLGEEIPEAKRIETQTGLRVLSLEYAAPEQITGEYITTATDVYTLGLLLYILITDSYPFDLSDKNQRKIEQVIRNQEPSKPSTILKNKKVKGDLDAIVLKALRKEPDKRYENAGKLLEDLQRYQKNLPVEARRDTIRYRVSKFSRRHASALTVTAAFLLMVIALVSYYTYELTAERNEARMQAQKAEQVSKFLEDLFKASDPEVALGETTTAGELLERGAKKIEDTLNEKPEVKASILDVLGNVYLNMGEYEKAESHFRKSLQLRRATNSFHNEIAKNLNYLSTSLVYQGNRESAKNILLEALDIHKKSDNPNVENYASTLNNLGAIYLRDNTLDSAEIMLRKAIDLRKNDLHDEASPNLSTNLDGLAMTLEKKGNVDEAEQYLLEALNIRKKTLPMEHPDIARSYNNIAGFMLRKGDFGSAEKYYRQALEKWRKVYGDDHPDVARAMNNLAAVLEKLGRIDEAVLLYEESISIKNNTLGKNHLSVAYSLANLGLLLRAKGELQAAEPLLKKSLQIRKDNFDNVHPAVAKGINNLAALYQDMQNYPMAIRYYREELELRSNINPVDSAHVLQAKLGLAKSLTANSAYVEAESILLEMKTEQRTRKKTSDKESRLVLKQLATLYSSWGKTVEANRYQALLNQQAQNQ